MLLIIYGNLGQNIDDPLNIMKHIEYLRLLPTVKPEDLQSLWMNLIKITEKIKLFKKLSCCR